MSKTTKRIMFLSFFIICLIFTLVLKIYIWSHGFAFAIGFTLGAIGVSEIGNLESFVESKGIPIKALEGEKYGNKAKVKRKSTKKSK